MSFDTAILSILLHTQNIILENVMVIICSNYLLFVFSLRDWKRLEIAEKSSLQVAAGINISEWGIKRQKKENTKKTKRRKREEGKKKKEKNTK